MSQYRTLYYNNYWRCN